MYQETNGRSRLCPGAGGASGGECLMFRASLLTYARPYLFVPAELVYFDAIF